MFWSTLILAIPAFALAAAVWGVLRRKWYGLLPLIPVAAAGWLWPESWWLDASEFLTAWVNQSRISENMMLLLADGAAVMCLAAIWAGWSRGWWFWRAIVAAAVPGSLVPLEANELILICLLVMPVLSGTAWMVRYRKDRRASADNQSHAPTRRQRQFSLADVLLAFIVLGVLAAILRSFIAGHITLADWGLLWLAGSIAAAALAAAAPALVRGTGKKWLLVWGTALAIGLASWWWLTWKSDPLGLAVFLGRDSPSATFPLYLAQGQLCFLALVGAGCAPYQWLGNSTTKPVTWRIAGGALLLLGLAMFAPLLAILPRLMPVKTSFVPLPPSKAFETIRRAAVELRLPTSSRDQFLAGFKRLDEQLVEPGHVNCDAAELARDRMTSTDSLEPSRLLMTELSVEIWRAVGEDRDDDAVQLARLQWRMGRTFYRGGTVGDSFFGLTMPTGANAAVIADAPTLTDEQCRQLLREAMDAEKSFPDFVTVRESDDYWRSVSTGWRDRLHDAAAWLAGGENSWNTPMSEANFESGRKRSAASLQAVQYVLALELYKRQHGQFPNDLSAVRSEYRLSELVDPYSSSAPIYRKSDDNYLLYSVGFNGQDDGGQFVRPNSSTPFAKAELDFNLLTTRKELVEAWQDYAKTIGFKRPKPTQRPSPSSKK